LFVAFFATACPSADAQKLKKVSPTKYESRAPARNYTFDWAVPLREYGAELGHDDIHIVRYGKNDSSDSLFGILDKRGKRPKWLLEPHYKYIQAFGANSVVATPVSRADETVCVLNLDDQVCQQTDFTFAIKLKHRDMPTLPDWVHEHALYVKTDRDGVYDLQLFSANEKPLTIVRDVVKRGEDLLPRVRTFAVGDSLVVRTVDADGKIRDAELSLGDDGIVSTRFQNPHSLLTMDGILNPVVNGKVDWVANTPFRKLIPFQTADVDLGFIWPTYETDQGARPLPDDLLGLRPLYFEFQKNRRQRGQFDEDQMSVTYCCDFPLVWAVAWLVGDDIAYALIPQISVPDYETVLATRETANYTEIDQLWIPGQDGWQYSNARNAREAGQLIGTYALNRSDGNIDIVTGDKYATNTGSTMIKQTSMPESSFSAWLINATAAEVQREADRQASYQALQDRKRAAKLAHEQAIAQQQMRLRQQRQAAEDARRAEREASATAEAIEPAQWTEKVYGDWAFARIGYCNTATWQTDLYAEANAKKACRDRGGTPSITVVQERGYDPFKASADQCYQARAVTDCTFNRSD
jgi:hypothetical protein